MPTPQQMQRLTAMTNAIKTSAQRAIVMEKGRVDPRNPPPAYQPQGPIATATSYPPRKWPPPPAVGTK